MLPSNENRFLCTLTLWFCRRSIVLLLPMKTLKASRTCSHFAVEVAGLNLNLCFLTLSPLFATMTLRLESLNEHQSCQWHILHQVPGCIGDKCILHPRVVSWDVLTPWFRLSTVPVPTEGSMCCSSGQRKWNRPSLDSQNCRKTAH